jgi:hypothetical protein
MMRLLRVWRQIVMMGFALVPGLLPTVIRGKAPTDGMAWPDLGFSGPAIDARAGSVIADSVVGGQERERPQYTKDGHPYRMILGSPVFVSAPPVSGGGSIV